MGLWTYHSQGTLMASLLKPPLAVSASAEAVRLRRKCYTVDYRQGLVHQYTVDSGKKKLYSWFLKVQPLKKTCRCSSEVGFLPRSSKVPPKRDEKTKLSSGPSQSSASPSGCAPQRLRCWANARVLTWCPCAYPCINSTKFSQHPSRNVTSHFISVKPRSLPANPKNIQKDQKSMYLQSPKKRLYKIL